MPEIGEIQNLDSDAAALRTLQGKKQRQPVSKNGKTPLVRKSGYDALDKNSFLKLLVTQLSKQDPTNPMNDREFISQMAQFSSLEQMNNVANSMNKLRGSQANQLIGKMVEGKDFVTEKPIQGIVTSALYQPNGDVLLKIGGRFTKFDDITSVTEVTPIAAPVTPVGPGNVSRETMPAVTLSPSKGDGADMVRQAHHGRGLKQAEIPSQNQIPVPQINPAQAAQAYEANQKSAERPAGPSTSPLPPGEGSGVRVQQPMQKNKIEDSKGE
jgi:flagellar basal-body rod modification protein FlgD